jgi:DNA segregation ATPase FtsK/SpoIIIE-like protein
LRYIKTVLIVSAAMVLGVALAQPARADVSFDMAYSNLNEHGSWLVSAQYGHVWQPREYNRQWSPYYDGHWVYTDMGWTWVSDYAWGAIPYHYGTWVNDGNVGWVWIPGRVWAPAWVVFRTAPDYIGWAPVPPGFSVGMSIEFGAPSSFVFVSSHDFLAPRVRTAIIPMERTNVFINNTTVVNNIVMQNNVVINRGPDYRTVEKATGRTIQEARIETVARVAPYDHVSRAQLAVEPGTEKRGVRVAEPVPASQPLPSASQQGRPSGQGHGQQPAVAPTAAAASTGHQNKSNGQPDAAQQQQHAKAQQDAAQQQQHAKAQSDAAQQQQHAKTQSDATQQQQHAKAQSDAAQQQQHAKAQSDAAQQQQHAKAQSDAAQQQQHAKAQQDPAQQQQHAKAQADAAQQQQHAKAQADAAQQQQHAKAQQDAKAKADPKAKKDQPEKKDQGSDKGAEQPPN